MKSVMIKKMDNGFVITVMDGSEIVSRSVCEGPFEQDGVPVRSPSCLLAFEKVIYRLSQALGVNLDDSLGNSLEIAVRQSKAYLDG